jgi:hypothetical protein
MNPILRCAAPILAIAASLLFAGAAAAQAQLVSASRLVSASMDGIAYCQAPDNFFCPRGSPPLSDPYDSASTTDLDDFDEQATTSFSVAEQTSSFSPLVLTGSGRAMASGFFADEYAFSNYFYFVMTSTARSDLSVTFDVDEATPYRFEATMSGTGVDRDCDGAFARTSSSCVETLHDSFLTRSVTLSRDGETARRSPSSRGPSRASLPHRPMQFRRLSTGCFSPVATRSKPMFSHSGKSSMRTSSEISPTARR